MFVLTFSLCFSLVACSAALTKHSTAELDDKYDFIIAGGGTTGLTVADRLSAAFPHKTVLVIEYGEPRYARGQFDPPDVVFGDLSKAPRPGSWSFTTLPSPAMNNRTAAVRAGQTVGGSSTINGMFFDRPSRADFDAWNQAGSPEWDAAQEKWDWRGIWPYFKKSVTFTPPTSEVQEKYGFTWDMSAYGGTTPIHSSFPPFLWGDHATLRKAWKDMGIVELNECAGGDKSGLCWIPTSQHPVTARRSHSGLGHYAEVSPRANYHMLIKHQVVRVLYPSGPSTRVPIVEVRSLTSNQYSNLTATAEVVISAGALHTPTILHRSGIGPSHILRALKIPVAIDLPGVGANLQDHPSPLFVWNYTKPANLTPVPSNMLDPVFVADATAGFNETPARGPYTLAMSNSAVYLSLPQVTSEHLSITTAMRAVAQNGTASDYLPEDYGKDTTLAAGYSRQLLVLADLLANPAAPSVEVPFSTGTSIRVILLHPLSRGTVRLNTTHPLEQPVLDYRAGSNPFDLDLHIAHLRFIRRILSTPTMAAYAPNEVFPGSSVRSDADLIKFVRNTTTLSLMHPCCTAAMLPRKLGGVIDPDLRVHGAKGLRIADISVLPFLVSSHTSSTAYAIGERAADIIIKSWSERN